MASNRSQGILGFIALLAISTGLGYGAWVALTRPKARTGQFAAARVAPENDSIGFVSVAAEGVDLEVLAPDGSRASTRGLDGERAKLAGSESSVDCPGFAEPDGKESACTASINVSTPPPGDYTVIARAAGRRSVLLNVGWATTSQMKRGAFDVRIDVPSNGATSFQIIVGRESVSQRSEPRPVAP